jgi:thiamine biosynthesis lipoprotein
MSLSEPSAPVSGAPPADAWRLREDAIMGTAIRVEFWCEDPALAARAFEAVLGVMHEVDRSMSPHRPDSELAAVNRDAARFPVVVGAPFFGLLERAREWAQRTGGDFDPSYASVGHLYDYRTGRMPDPEQLARARSVVGWEGLQLDSARRSVAFARPGMRIDLGGIAKGYAVDEAIGALRGLGIAHAHVSAGGDGRVLGDRRGRPWAVGVADPRLPGQLVAVLPLRDIAISTSGDYERFFMREGVRHHHILDPRTGRSPAGVRAVTVLAADGVTAEALGKAVFLRGPQAGLQLIDGLPGVDALVIDEQGRLHVSAGFTQPVPERGHATGHTGEQP